MMAPDDDQLRVASPSTSKDFEYFDTDTNGADAMDEGDATEIAKLDFPPAVTGAKVVAPKSATNNAVSVTRTNSTRKKKTKDFEYYGTDTNGAEAVDEGDATETAKLDFPPAVTGAKGAAPKSATRNAVSMTRTNSTRKKKTKDFEYYGTDTNGIDAMDEGDATEIVKLDFPPAVTGAKVAAPKSATNNAVSVTKTNSTGKKTKITKTAKSIATAKRRNVVTPATKNKKK
jgi:hypothetical protein